MNKKSLKTYDCSLTYHKYTFETKVNDKTVQFTYEFVQDQNMLHNEK
jgi:hypothetical protein